MIENERVFCDVCGKDWTGRPESGGFLFFSKVVCPTCTPRMMMKLMYRGQDNSIQICPPDKSFYQWCLFSRS